MLAGHLGEDASLGNPLDMALLAQLEEVVVVFLEPDPALAGLFEVGQADALAVPRLSTYFIRAECL